MFDYEYDEIFMEGYYDAMSDILLEEEKTSYNNGKPNEPNHTSYKKVNRNGQVSVEAAAGGNGVLHKLYAKYLAKCRAKNRKPMPFIKWKLTRGAAIVAAAGATTTGTIVGTKAGIRMYRKHKSAKSQEN